MPELVTLTAITEAAARIRGVVRRTPILELSPLSALGPAGTAPLRVKCENFQPIGAFKIRGASNMLARLPAHARRRGVITYSSGNHGLALAFAAKRLGVPAVIVMPTTAPAIKVEGARGLGAEITFEGTTTIQRKARAERIAAERSLTVVPPFDHEWIIAGQGTIGLEILEQCPEVATVYVPVGGGGLISGVAAAIKRSKPSVSIVGVEPTGAPKLTASLRAGQPVTIEDVSSIADGLLTVRPGELTFAHIKAFADRVVTIDDAATREAMRALFHDGKMVAEPSGAITVAAAMADAKGELGGTLVRADAPKPGPGPAVAVISGGNIDAERFCRYIGGQ